MKCCWLTVGPHSSADLVRNAEGGQEVDQLGL